MKRDIKYQASKALQFLNNHPAYINGFSDDFLGSQCVGMYPVCKNGVDENSKRCAIIRKGEKGWEKFKNRFEEDDTYIYVTYLEKYGYPWVYDHVEYFYEADFFIFTGNAKDRKETLNFMNFSRYHGFTGNATSFEEAIIQCKKDTMKIFGNFGRDDFYTAEEIDNHKKERCFFFKEIEEGPHKGHSEMISNPNYIDVTDALLNLRWLKWFVETPYCKKYWKQELDRYVSDIEM